MLLSVKISSNALCGKPLIRTGKVLSGVNLVVLDFTDWPAVKRPYPMPGHGVTRLRTPMSVILKIF